MERRREFSADFCVTPVFRFFFLLLVSLNQNGISSKNVDQTETYFFVSIATSPKMLLICQERELSSSRIQNDV